MGGLGTGDGQWGKGRTSLKAFLFVVALRPSNTPVRARISLPVHTVKKCLIDPFPLRSRVFKNSTKGPVLASPPGPLQRCFVSHFSISHYSTSI
jgi:hypothetical protein